MDKRLELIEKYLHRQLSDSEWSRLQEQLKGDPELAEELGIAAILNADYNATHKLRWKQLLAEQTDSITAPPENVRKLTSRRRTLYYITAIAAALLIAVFAIILSINTNNLDQQLNDHIAQHHHAPTTTMGTPNSNERWELAIVAYQQAEYEGAATQISAIIDDGTTTPELYFYLGLCQLYQHEANYEAAVDNFNRVLATSNAFQEETKWFISLAYLKLQQLEDARRHLEQLANAQGWKSIEARQLLESVDSEQ